MTGFSAEWLALREPVDHRSRSPQLLSELQSFLQDRPTLHITDLGCGTGSNLRALAPQLGPLQHWLLVDYDPALLRAAADALASWADKATTRSDGQLELASAGRQILVSFQQADLNQDLDAVLDRPADVVTAAAFFDLVSAAWIERFVAACVSRKRPLYTVLTYDGREIWTPPHPSDAQVLAAFHAHQKSDKGFGAAAGPHATGCLQVAFEGMAWTVTTASSPWKLGPSEQALTTALATGAATAVAETGKVSATDLASWLEARSPAQTCEIGHLDLFARP